ncbi:VTC domain-containing protein [Thalassoporum mexicanum PCC 7367]|uniref:polyphosphate polymerase domain-containing protein n=1 Tax=Thalassoporum mexicanum TaxID=3457544 RepID=UPI00029FBB55|nr:polyphosphate polymerase domain-containing protein [Pseudanabaena sp. PCC 7367]AFY71570.1 VTC domain-containing protein [Pseudanabaena sp. PCC 7367]
MFASRLIKAIQSFKFVDLLESDRAKRSTLPSTSLGLTELQKSAQAELKNSRYEIKIVGDRLMLPQLRAWLRVHPAAFRPAFPDRQVNNVYFDTPHLHSYMENVSGVSERRKLRLRWYGDRYDQIQGRLELKGKFNNLGWKRSQKINMPLDLTKTTWRDLVKTMRSQLEPEFGLYLDSSGWAVMLNAYHREYYVSFSQQVRITIDNSIKVFDQRLSPLPNLTKPHPPSNLVIIEIKASRDCYDLISGIAGSFPLRVTKHSKYSSAMEELLR